MAARPARQLEAVREDFDRALEDESWQAHLPGNQSAPATVALLFGQPFIPLLLTE